MRYHASSPASATYYPSVYFIYVLTLIFVIAKLAGAISWSWWWVFSPIWIPFAIILTIFIVVLIAVWIFDR